MDIIKSNITGIFFCVLLIALGSCSRVDDEQALRSRVQEYWHMRCKGQVSDLYRYEYPLFKKEITQSEYEKYYKLIVQYENATVGQISIDPSGDAADVKINVVAGIKPPGSRKVFKHPVEITERWVKGPDGVWYHVPKKILKRRK